MRRCAVALVETSPALTGNVSSFPCCARAAVAGNNASEKKSGAKSAAERERFMLGTLPHSAVR
jgi:hypothetical protein